MNSTNRCIFLLLTLAVTGCASLEGEATVDWFVRVASEPRMENTRFCVSSAPETKDGSNPTERGMAHIWCGNNLDTGKKQAIANCEKDQKLKCMLKSCL